MDACFELDLTDGPFGHWRVFFLVRPAHVAAGLAVTDGSTVAEGSSTGEVPAVNVNRHTGTFKVVRVSYRRYVTSDYTVVSILWYPPCSLLG